MPAPLPTAPRTALVPAPRHLSEEAGDFVLAPSAALWFSPRFAAQAAWLAARLREATGHPLPAEAVHPPAPGPLPADRHLVAIHHGRQPDLPALGFGFPHLEGGHLCLIPDDTLAPEEYRLTVDTFGVRLLASTPQGMAHAAHTLLQLGPPALLSPSPRIGVAWRFPCARITDRPLHSWRGAMLDCARHFIPLPALRRFIETMALHHLNILHLHLCDDQGWRLEIKALPLLTRVGGFRAGTQRGHRRSGAGVDTEPRGGFYTQEEMRDLITFAADRGVTLLPEIDLPGHFTAALAAYPELASGDPPAAPASTYGVLPHLLFPSEENLARILPALVETMRLFPCPWLHIGGDEVLLERWENDPRTPALLRRLGLSRVDELQPWLTRRLQQIAADHGKRIVGWDEIASRGLAPGTIIMAWRDPEVSILPHDYDTVVALSSHAYLDYYQSPDTASEPLAIGGVTTLKKAYHLDPSALPRPGRILGVQAQLWTEYMPDPAHIDYMAFPRLCALAEVGWSEPGRKDWADFRRRLSTHLRRLAIRGVRYRAPDDHEI